MIVKQTHSHAAWSACAQAHGKVTPAGLAPQGRMSKSPFRRFPVTVTQLPVTRCEIRRRTPWRTGPAASVRSSGISSSDGTPDRFPP